MLNHLFLLSIIVSSCLCQYSDNSEYNQQPRKQYNYDQDNYREKNPRYSPQILSHKQSLNHDGTFKYVFASDNGLLQGESIAPDGSRTGAYAYVDPNGRKISVKYIAGKEGFKILEGDHIPKAHPLLAASNQEPHPGYGGGGSQNQENRNYAQSEGRQPIYEERRPPLNFDQYRTQIHKPVYTQTYKPHYNPIDEGILAKSRALNRPVSPERSNEVIPFPVAQHYKGPLQNREPEYDDEPGKPNSFGSGYSFEFAG